MHRLLLVPACSSCSVVKKNHGKRVEQEGTKEFDQELLRK
jgi:hypothetical protein